MGCTHRRALAVVLEAKDALPYFLGVAGGVGGCRVCSQGSGA